MTDVLIQSSLQNPILSGLYKALESPLTYRSGANYPALSKQIVAINPNVAPANPPWNSEMTFNIPRNGFLDDLMLETTFNVATTGSALTTSTDVGFTIFNRVELLAQNKVIQTIYPSAMRAEVAGMDNDRALAYRRMAFTCDPPSGEALGDVPIGSARTVYTPIFSTLFRNERNSLDLTKLEDIQVRFYWNTQNLSGLVNVATFTSISCNLYMWSHNFAADYYNSLRAQNFKTGGLLNILSTDYFRETFTPVASATSTDLAVRCNGSCYWTAISITDQYHVLQNIQSVSFKANGRTILSNLPHNIVSLEQFIRGSLSPSITPTNTSNATNAVLTANAQDVVVIYWNLGNDNTDEQKGVLSLRGLSNPTFTITHASAQSTWTITLLHKLLTITSLGQDGSITVSTTA